MGGEGDEDEAVNAADEDAVQEEELEDGAAKTLADGSRDE